MLIVYYSYSKSTKELAEKITAKVNGDIRELIPVNPYSFDYNTASKEARNQINRGYCPKLAFGNESIDKYNTIAIGSPNWFKSFAPPVLTFLRSHDFSNKKILPFCTHGGGGFGQIQEKIAIECPNSTILTGLSSAFASATPEQIESWLKKAELL